ncbi:helix-turn-helix domain-containing protein [Jatrophihabitans sp. DSM 45814]
MTTIANQPKPSPTSTRQSSAPVGALLRQWRERRRLSQLDLALQTDISARHLSFVETGRSKPSSEMILRLTEELEVPLRERNRVLLAGGFAPVYSERPLNAPQMTAVRSAVQQVLVGHEPYPAILIDRHWNLLDANAAVPLFLQNVDPQLLATPANVLRLSLHPDGMAPQIVNLGEWRAHLLARLRRQAAVTQDQSLRELHAELTALPCDQPEPAIDLPGKGNVIVPLQFRVASGQILSFISITAIFGTPLDITLSELAIESFYPADAATADHLRA